ncbi:hypothetical protein K438DRAFT_1782501 [Mycena galopus ATCC 62051]|nr:hypothetical protein K438DRAFT_1782501 [Mycena galopus ATCC 62051]
MNEMVPEELHYLSGRSGGVAIYLPCILPTRPSSVFPRIFEGLPLGISWTSIPLCWLYSSRILPVQSSKKYNTPPCESHLDPEVLAIVSPAQLPPKSIRDPPDLRARSDRQLIHHQPS